MKGHLPERTCAVCRDKKSKALLLRIVRRPGGELEIDPGQKKTGRGAYLCLNRACIGKAVKKQITQRCFHLPAPAGFQELLTQYIDVAD